jgi:hypothetical protein
MEGAMKHWVMLLAVAGLLLATQGETRGTIANPEFIHMYYVYNFGEKADARIRDGLLGK